MELVILFRGWDWLYVVDGMDWLASGSDVICLIVEAVRSCDNSSFLCDEVINCKYQCCKLHAVNINVVFA